jgi:hypothetical protein
MEKSRLVKVINKFSGSVGYEVPDLGVYRNFQPRESKDITIEELEKLSYIPGGLTILKEYLEITDADIAEKILNGKLEPEYFYTEEDIKRLMVSGSMDEFLDCLDFAPLAVQELIKDMAVNLPLNDIAKREAIKEKLDFDVSRAIEIKNTNFDGGDAASSDEPAKTKRRVAARTTSTTTGRRVQPINK